MTRSVKRSATIGLVGATVVAVALWLTWVFYVPHHRPPLSDGEVFGVDVSNHQGAIGWHAVASDDIDFAYIKATEGGDFVDGYFSVNWTGARDAGLNVGAYHFFTFCTPGAEQAANVLDTVPLDEMDLPIALDLEFGGNCAARPSHAWMEREIATFINVVEGTTNEPVLLYIGEHFEDAYGLKESLDRELWERQLWRRPPHDNWTFWQLSFRSAIDGIEGGVDLNVGRPSPARS